MIFAKNDNGTVRIYRAFIIFILFLTFFSCKTKKTIIEKEYIKTTDTLVVNKDRFITKEIKDTLVIEEPCDSLGILKPFKSVLNTGRGKVTIESRNGNIEAKINLDSIVSSIESKYKSKSDVKTVEKTKEIIKYRTPIWVFLLLFFSFIFNAYMLRKHIPSIVGFVKKIF